MPGLWNELDPHLNSHKPQFLICKMKEILAYFLGLLQGLNDQMLLAQFLTQHEEETNKPTKY